MELIKIGKPYILQNCENGRVRLCADIIDDSEKTLYFEVDSEFKEFLVVENSDAFVLGLLHHAMNEGKNIACEIGVTGQLLFQLRNYYIPIISRNMPDLYSVKIYADSLATINNNEKGVVTGNSGGVDSFYTILKYNKEPNQEFKLTHLIFNNISTEDSDDSRIRKVFEKDILEKNAIAKEVGLVPVNLYSNLYAFYKSHFIYNYYYAAQYCSAVYALGRLFSVFYFSAGDTLLQFSVDHNKIDDGSDFDLFSLDCFSINNLKVYSAGIEADRHEKMQFIVNNPCVQSHLQVCAQEQYEGYYKSENLKLEKLNCGVCRKCRRTISMLYCDGILDKYKDIFDLSEFQANKSKFIGYELATDHNSYTRVIEKRLSEKNILPRYPKVRKLIWKVRFRITRIKLIRLVIRIFKN